MPNTNFMYELRTVAKDIVDQIGYQKLYTVKNSLYPTAPSNLSIHRIETVTKYIRSYLRQLDPSKSLIIKFDHHAPPTIYGVYVNYNDLTCYIILNPNNNHCWRRFALLKELCSVYISLYKTNNYKKSPNDNYLDALEKAFTQKERYIKLNAFIEEDVDDETYAILLATELMIPIGHRQLTRDLIQKVNEGSMKLNDVAKSLLIPELVLDLFIKYGCLDEKPAYEDFN